LAEQTTETTAAPQRTAFQEWDALPADKQALSSETEIDTASETAPASEPEQQIAEQQSDREQLPKGLKKRFSKLTSEIRELKAALAQKDGAAAENTGVATPPKAAEKSPETGKPVAANYTTYEEYVEALTDWKLEQREALRKQVEAQQSTAETVRTQVEAARAKYPDYDEVVNDQVPISPAMAEVLVASEHGADVAYWLGSNPADCAKIAKMTPAQAGAALARIEAQLSESAPAKPQPKAAVTKAPKPPATVQGGSGSADPEPDPKNYQAWEKWENRRLKRLAAAEE
jgi:hypothetical protein